MEQTSHEKTEQELHLKTQKLPSGVEKPTASSPIPLQKLGALGKQHLQTSFASQTPEKIVESSHSKRKQEADDLPEKTISESSDIKDKQEADDLPEKYRVLSEFFDRLISSIRLLALRKRLPTFQNISGQVERMTGRTFQHRHLAQMKYIFPEAMKIEKILVHDDKTLCMKPDLTIVLVSDFVEQDREPSIFVALSDLFAIRLRKFFSAQLEFSDVPEAELPELFNQSSTTTAAASSCAVSSMLTETDISNPSHLCPSFSRRFSRNDIVRETKETQLFTSPLPDSPTKVDHLSDQEMETIQPPDSFSVSSVTKATELACPPSDVSTNASESTPLKLPLESDNIMLATPAQSTPKRSIPTCDNKLKTVINENTASSLTAKRSLDFFRLEGEESISNVTTDGIEESGTVQNDILPGVETKGDMLKDDNTASLKPLFKVEESDSFAGNSRQRGLTEHHQTSVCLSDLVSVIHQIFESASCHSITKQELVHKIIMNSLDIDENSDIEGQIELLEKLVPDWICKKLTPTGDLYSIKKVSDLNFVQERLVSI